MPDLKGWNGAKDEGEGGDYHKSYRYHSYHLKVKQLTKLSAERRL